MSPLRRPEGATVSRPPLGNTATEGGGAATRLVTWAGVIAIAAGAGVLVAWWSLGDPRFEAWLTPIKMRPNTALGCVAAGMSLLLMSRRSSSRVRLAAAHLLAVLPLLIGVVTIAEYTGAVRQDVDEVLLPAAIRRHLQERSAEADAAIQRADGLDPISGNTGSGTEIDDAQAANRSTGDVVTSARPHSLSAASLVMIGMGLLLIDINAGASQLLGFAGILLGILATLSQLFGVEHLTGWGSYAEMAPEAALTMALLSLGLILARPHVGPVAILTADNAGGVAARRLLPPLMAVLVLAGVLVVYGDENAWFEMRFGVAGMVLSSIVILTGLIWLSARRLGEIDDERRLAEQKTAEQRDWLATTLASIADAVVTTDKDGRITFVNRRAEQLTGWTRAEAVGKPLHQIVTLLDEQTGAPALDPTASALRLRGDDQSDLSLLLTRRDGRRMPISHSLSAIRRHPERGGSGAVLVFRDVEQERQAQAALKESESRFRSILDNTQAAVFAKDRQGRYIIANRHLAQMFGWKDPSFPLGKTDWDLHPPEMARIYSSNDHNVLETNAPQEFEEAVVINGQTQLYLVQKFPLRDAAGATYGVCGIANDITRRKQNEMALLRHARQQQAAAELGSVALSEHDLQQVLDRCVETVAAVLGNEYCKVLQKLPGNGRLLLRAGAGWRDGLVGKATVGGDCESHAGFTLRSNEPVIVEDLNKETRFRNSALLDSHGVVSGMSCIIPGPDGEAWGVLGTHTRQLVRYTTDGINFLQTVAHIIASALQRGAAEEALRRSEQQLRFTLEAARVGSWDWDIRTGQVHWSENLEEIHGMPPGTFGGTLQDVLDEVYSQDRPQLKEAIDRALTSDGRFESTYRYQRSDGSVGWLQAQGHVLFDDDDRPLRMAGLCMDVTQRRRNEELTRLLAEAGAHLGQTYAYESSLQIVAELLIPAFGDWCAIDLLDESGQLQSVAIVHSDPQKIGLARELRRRYPPRTHETRGAMQVIRSGQPQLFPRITAEDLEASAEDAEHLRLMQELQVESAMIVPLLAHGRILGVLTLASAESNRCYTGDDLGPVEELAIRCALAVDNARLYEEAQQEIRQRQHTEALLARAHDAAAAANAAKSEFLANMSHEIRTPMTAVLGYTEILSSHLEDPDDLQCVETIRRNGQFLLEIVNDILDLSKIEAGKLEVAAERFRPDRLVSDVLSLMEVRAREKRLLLTARFDGPIPETIESDPTRLRQILINLLGNAIKFTETGQVELNVRLLESDEQLELEVVDTGIGMSQEQISRLFEPFSQADTSVVRNYGGTGLGLSISRRLAEMLGGRIMAQSELGRGSRFTVTIRTGSLENVPRIEPLQDFEADFTESESPDVSLDCRVLVVDDRQDIRFLAEHFIRDAGGEVVTANNGEDALERLQQCRNAGIPVDLILMDVQMPVMDGYAAATRLREQGFEGPVIALTANAMQGDRERCLEAGFDDHTSKPLNGPQLVSMISRYTTQGSSGELAEPTTGTTREQTRSEADVQAADQVQESSPQGCRVLFVDDSEDLCRMMRMLLESRGHQVKTARTGTAALEMAARFAPEAVLLDLTLPDMSGCDVATRLQALSQTRDSVLIAVSGDSTPETLVRVRRSGFHHHLLKPVDVQELESLFPISSGVT